MRSRSLANAPPSSPLAPACGDAAMGAPVGTAVVQEHGLTNDYGENNCFLNGVLQTLWHLNAFRSAITKTDHPGCKSGACVLCQLRVRPMRCRPERRGLGARLTAPRRPGTVPLSPSLSWCGHQNLFVQLQHTPDDNIPPTAVRTALAILHQSEARRLIPRGGSPATPLF